MKICKKCSAHHDRNHAWCSACFNAYQLEWQRRNKDRVRTSNQTQYQKHRKERLVRQLAYRQENAQQIKEKLTFLQAEKRAVVAAAKDRPCADCGENWPTVAMDFDHVRGEKKYGIAHMAGGPHSMKALLEEIAKCEVVCACCHRIRTHRNGGTEHLARVLAGKTRVA